jgi:hypothetical protein
MKEKELFSILISWLEHEQKICNPAKHLLSVDYYSGICCEAQYTKELIEQLLKNPQSVIDKGRKEGWL